MGTMYRILFPLMWPDGKRVEKGEVSSLTRCPPSVIRKLLDSKRIVKVQPPPLSIIPGWEERAEMLKGVGIEDVSQLVTADLEKVAKELGVTLDGLQRTAEEARKLIE